MNILPDIGKGSERYAWLANEQEISSVSPL
jgi:hypothetical protein